MGINGKADDPRVHRVGWGGIERGGVASMCNVQVNHTVEFLYAYPSHVNQLNNMANFILFLRKWQSKIKYAIKLTESHPSISSISNLTSSISWTNIWWRHDITSRTYSLIYSTDYFQMDYKFDEHIQSFCDENKEKNEQLLHIHHISSRICIILTIISVNFSEFLSAILSKNLVQDLISCHKGSCIYD